MLWLQNKIYNSSMILTDILLFLFSFFISNIKKFRQIRKTNQDQLQTIQQAAMNRPIWVLHGASVGELEQVFALIQPMKKKIQIATAPFIVLSYFSPSAQKKVENWQKTNAEDFAFWPLPVDTTYKAKSWIRKIKPQLFIAGSYDIWPNITKELSKNKIPIFLISALLSERSKRFQGFWKTFYQDVYNRLSLIDAVDQETAQKFQQHLNRPKITWHGDTRCDAIQSTLKSPLEESKKSNLTILKKFTRSDNHTVFLAASTYKECDTIILPTLKQQINQNQSFLTLYFPHHTDEQRITSLSHYLKELSINFVLLSDLLWQKNKAHENHQLCLVDQMGLLIHSYSLADFVFVGGSFHKKIHNTYEPAAQGLPLAYGPFYKNAPEAIRFANLGGASIVHNQQEFQKWFQEMLTQDELRKQTGKKNQLEFQRNLGASQKVAESIANLISMAKTNQ